MSSLEDESPDELELLSSYRQAEDFEEQNFLALALAMFYTGKNNDLALHYFDAINLEIQSSTDFSGLAYLKKAQALAQLGMFDSSLELLYLLQDNEKYSHLQVEVLEQVLDNLWEKRDYPEFLRHYKVYAKKKRFSRQDEHLAYRASLGYQYQKDYQNHIALLEELSFRYPITSPARWAVKQLIELSCEQRDNQKPYSFPLEVLKRISRNSSLDQGIGTWLFGMLDQNLVIENKLRPLTILEKSRYSRRFKVNSPVSDQLGIALEEKEGKAENKRYMLALARRYTADNQLEKALEVIDSYINSFKMGYSDGDIFLRKGRILFRKKRFGEAAKEFGEAAKRSRRKVAGWLKFQSLYRQGNFQAALVQLKKSQSLDSNKLASSIYWRGVVHAKLGQNPKAQSEFRKLVSRFGTTYYAIMAIKFYPQFQLEKAIPISVREGEFVEQRKTAIFRGLVGKKSARKTELRYSDSMSFASSLSKLGFANYARSQLTNRVSRGVKTDKEFFEFRNIAWRASYFGSNRLGRSYRLSGRKKRIRSIYQLLEDQKTHDQEWMFSYPLAYDEMLDPIENKIGVEKFLMLSLMRSESFYNPNAISRVGALGLMQIMPYTGVKIARVIEDYQFNLHKLTLPKNNIVYGAAYFKRLISYFGSKIPAIAGYNAGPGVVKQWISECSNCTVYEFIEGIPYRETRRYLKKVIRYYAHYNRIYRNDLYPAIEKWVKDPINPNLEVF